MRRVFLTTAIVCGFVAPALANDQLANPIGVDSGMYTATELVQLRTALEDGNRTQAKFIMQKHSDVISTQSVGSSSGKAQLAASLGVNPADYSLTDLIRIRDAQGSEGRRVVAFIKSGGQDVISTQSRDDTTGRSQLAARMGLDPAQYTTAELVQKMLRSSNDD